VIQKSRPVQLLAHLNPEVVEVFSDLDLLEIPFLFISRDRRGFENRVGLLLVNGTSGSSWSLTAGEMENGHCLDASACHRWLSWIFSHVEEPVVEKYHDSLPACGKFMTHHEMLGTGGGR
jgi:hypothetical protein